eukprot:CAMPEP_0171326152 /NCGR_PEP_ID=MMETSP0816-20121228/117264_1 /TAXON_ID=420281 /ORGANISM="Proboscia inermis, Strain CCAP1064/1" /LENGTH=38 /DNA_ID= /DNA_START= /DNA_END= /DNA_ORIENTATION=
MTDGGANPHRGAGDGDLDRGRNPRVGMGIWTGDKIPAW